MMRSPLFPALPMEIRNNFVPAQAPLPSGEALTPRFHARLRAPVDTVERTSGVIDERRQALLLAVQKRACDVIRDRRGALYLADGILEHIADGKNDPSTKLLNATLADIKERRRLAAKLPLSMEDTALCHMTLNAFEELACLAWVLEHPSSKAATEVIHARPVPIARQYRHDFELGIYQEAVVQHLRRTDTKMLGIIADNLPELRAAMPVLDATVDALTANGAQPLADANVVVLGHVLSEAPAFMAAIAKLGAERATTRIAPVPYSSNALAIERLKREGYSIHVAEQRPRRFFRVSSMEGGGAPVPTSLVEAGRQGYDVVLATSRDQEDPSELASRDARSYASIKDAQVRRTIEAAIADHRRNRKRIVIIDDGGYAFALVQREFPRYLQSIQFVEQTTRGIRRIEASGTGGAAVVSVATSRPKLEIEAPFVADACVAAVRGHVHGLFGPVNRNKSAGVIGYGAIGKQTAKALLAEGFRVVVYDNDRDVLARAHDDGFIISTTAATAVRHRDIVFGCTGKTSVTPEIMRWADHGTVFASLSSGDIEFHDGQPSTWGTMEIRLHEEAELVEHAKPSVLTMIPSAAKWIDAFAKIRGRDPAMHSMYVVLNGGYPLNLTRQLTCMPAEQIQVTMACLVAGAAQDTRGQQGILKLARENEIVRDYERLTA